jgi:hypothetical protein
MFDEFHDFWAHYARRTFTTLQLQLGTEKIATLVEMYARRGLRSTGVYCILRQHIFNQSKVSKQMGNESPPGSTASCWSLEVPRYCTGHILHVDVVNRMVTDELLRRAYPQHAPRLFVKTAWIITSRDECLLALTRGTYGAERMIKTLLWQKVKKEWDRTKYEISHLWAGTKHNEIIEQEETPRALDGFQFLKLYWFTHISCNESIDQRNETTSLCK